MSYHHSAHPTSSHCSTFCLNIHSPMLDFHMNGIIILHLLCLVSFTHHDVLNAHSYHQMYQYSIPFSGQVIFHQMNMARFIYPLSTDGHSSGLHLLTTMNDAAVNIWMQGLCGHKFSFLLHLCWGVKLRDKLYLFLFLLQCLVLCFMQCETSVDTCYMNKENTVISTRY